MMEADEASGCSPARKSTIAGIVFGEFDRIPEADDAFLELVGYSREDLEAGRLHWPDLNPPEIILVQTSLHTQKDCGSRLARLLRNS